MARAPDSAAPKPRPTRRRRWVAWGAAAFVGAAAAAYGPWVWVSARSDGHIHTLADAPSAPVTIVLGAGLNPDGTPSAFLAARLEVAKALVDSGRTQVLLVSGDNRFVSYDEPTAMRDYLVDRGVPTERIVRDFAGRDTYDTCARSKRIFGVDQALVVSQGYHLPRAVATCRTLGIEAEGVGDWSVQSIGDLWANGELRERPAAIKAAWELTIRRDPVLGPPETAVIDALAAVH